MGELDRTVRDLVVDHRIGLLDPFFQGLSYVGSFGIVWLALAVAISGFSWSRPWLWTRVGAAILLAEGISGGLKEWIERDRPPVADPEPEPLVGLPATYSFPSGHATVAFACATILALAGLIAFSRVYVGVHFPLDVVAGAALGVGIATALRMLAEALRRSAPPLPPG